MRLSLSILIDGVEVHMKTVKDVLEVKGYNTIWSVSPDAMVYDALKLMDEINVGALLVIDEGELVGIISERDCARKLTLQGKSAIDTPVESIMTSQIDWVTPDAGLDQCVKLMKEKKFRHLPVFEEGNLIGIISVGNILKTVMCRQSLLKS